MKFCSSDLDSLFAVMRWRRDVRHFRPDPVPEEALRILAQAMSLAPSVGNSRPWRVIRVEDADVRGKVRTVFEDCNAAAAQHYSGERRDAYGRLKLAGIDTAPVQLAIFTHADPAEGHGLGRRTMPETLLQSTAMAIFALWLAARAQNLGVGLLSILDPERIERILDVPRPWRFSAWVCIGFPAFDDDRPLLHRLDWQSDDEHHWMTR